MASFNSWIEEIIMIVEVGDVQEESFDRWKRPSKPQQPPSQPRHGLQRNDSERAHPAAACRGAGTSKGVSRPANSKVKDFSSFEKLAVSTYGTKRSEQIGLRAPIPVSTFRKKFLLELSASDNEKTEQASNLNPRTRSPDVSSDANIQPRERPRKLEVIDRPPKHKSQRIRSGCWSRTQQTAPQPQMITALKNCNLLEPSFEHASRAMVSNYSLADASITADIKRLEHHKSNQQMSMPRDLRAARSKLQEASPPMNTHTDRPLSKYYITPSTSKTLNKPEAAKPQAVRSPITHLAALTSKPPLGVAGVIDQSQLLILSQRFQKQGSTNHTLPGSTKLLSSKISREHVAIYSHSQNQSLQLNPSLKVKDNTASSNKRVMCSGSQQHSVEKALNCSRPLSATAQIETASAETRHIYLDQDTQRLVPQASDSDLKAASWNRAETMFQRTSKRSQTNQEILRSHTGETRDLNTSRDKTASIKNGVFADTEDKTSKNEATIQSIRTSHRSDRLDTPEMDESALRARINQLILENSKLRKERDLISANDTICETPNTTETDYELTRLRCSLEEKSTELIESQQEVISNNQRMRELEKELIRLRETEHLLHSWLQSPFGAQFAQPQQTLSSPAKVVELEKKIDLLTHLQTQSLLRATDIKDLCRLEQPPLLAALREVRDQVEQQQADLIELVIQKEKLEGTIEGLKEGLRRDTKAGTSGADKMRSAVSREEKKAFLEDGLPPRHPTKNSKLPSESTAGMNLHYAFGSLLQDGPSHYQHPPSTPESKDQPSISFPATSHPRCDADTHLRVDFEGSAIVPSPQKIVDTAERRLSNHAPKGLLASVVCDAQDGLASSMLEPNYRSDSHEGVLTSTVLQSPVHQPSSNERHNGPFHIALEPVLDSEREDVGVKPHEEAVKGKEPVPAVHTGLDSSDRYAQVLEENRRLLEAYTKAKDENKEAPQAKMQTADEGESTQRFRRLDYFGERPSIPSSKFTFVSINESKDPSDARKPQAESAVKEKPAALIEPPKLASIYSFQPPEDMISALSNYVNSFEQKSTDQQTYRPHSRLQRAGSDYSVNFTDSTAKPSLELATFGSASLDLLQLQAPTNSFTLTKQKTPQECMSAFNPDWPIAERPEHEEAFLSSHSHTCRRSDSPVSPEPQLEKKPPLRQFTFKDSPQQSTLPKNSADSPPSPAEEDQLLQDSMARDVLEMKRVLASEREERDRITRMVAEKEEEAKQLRQRIADMASSSLRHLDKKPTSGQPKRAKSRVNKPSGASKDEHPSKASPSSSSSSLSRDLHRPSSDKHRIDRQISYPDSFVQTTYHHADRLEKHSGRFEQQPQEKPAECRSSSRLRSIAATSVVSREERFVGESHADRGVTGH